MSRQLLLVLCFYQVLETQFSTNERTYFLSTVLIEFAALDIQMRRPGPALCWRLCWHLLPCCCTFLTKVLVITGSSVVTAIVSYLILKCKFWASVLFNNTIIEISVKDREPRGIIPLENLQVREVQDARRKVIFMPNIP